MPRYRDFYGFVVYYWSNEGKPLEPLHFHVAKQPRKNATKVWILSDGTLEIDFHDESEISKKQLNRIIRLMQQYIDDYTAEWETFFGKNASYIR